MCLNLIKFKVTDTIYLYETTAEIFNFIVQFRVF